MRKLLGRFIGLLGLAESRKAKAQIQAPPPDLGIWPTPDNWLLYPCPPEMLHRPLGLTEEQRARLLAQFAPKPEPRGAVIEGKVVHSSWGKRL